MKVERSEETALMVPESRIDITNSNELKQTFLELFDEGYSTFVIDFGQVDGIDSSGLGKLLLFQKKLKERSGELKIINISSEYVKKMFAMIHLNKVITIED